MLERLQAFIKDYGVERTDWLAYSGGLDSQVLLQLCSQLREHYPFSFRAIHIHHGLSPRAEEWLLHCKQSCAQAHVELVCCCIEVRPPAGESLKAYAREQRYAVLKDHLHPGDILFTAHHQDDQ